MTLKLRVFSSGTAEGTWLVDADSGARIEIEDGKMQITVFHLTPAGPQEPARNGAEVRMHFENVPLDVPEDVGPFALQSLNY